MGRKGPSIFLVLITLLFAMVSVATAARSDAAEPARPPGFPDYPNSALLLSGKWLQENLRAKNLAILDARTAGYESTHIPGAISLAYDDYKTKSELKPQVELEARLSAAGLRPDMKFVIYDDTTASWGAAGRVFWMLEYLGCKDVHVLNGGWDKWVADGRPTETRKQTLPPGKFVAVPNEEILVRSSHILSRMRDRDFALIDARTDEEFNGWQLYGEARGGHIPGAVQIPYAWYFNPDKTVLAHRDLRKLFDARGITPEKEVVSYCTVGIRSGHVYFLLRLMGYPRCANYDGSLLEWSANPDFPLEKLTNYSKLVSAEWVKDLIDGKKVSHTPKGRYLLAAVGYADEPPKTYIPGAFYIHRDEFEFTARNAKSPGESGAGNLWPDPKLKANIEKMGIDKDTTVILYHHYAGSPGAAASTTAGADPICAVRLLWALMYAGVQDVRLVNGGLGAWVRNGYPVSSTAGARPIVTDCGIAPFPAHPEYLATTPYIEQVVDGTVKDALLADIRSMEEYIGAKEDYPYLDTLGRIPGAKWGHWGPSTYVGGDFWDAQDGTLRSYSEVAQMWKDYGITGDKTLSFYCGTGWRSSLAFFYGYLMGWPNVKNYDGSWYEWSLGAGSEKRGKESGWPF